MTASKRFDPYPAVWVIDTEFQAPGGEQNRPVCLCARDLKSGREVELFFDGPAECPFDLANDLFVGYNASAEWKTFLSLGWGMPEHIIDLFFEFLNLINGIWLDDNSTTLRDVGTGLLAALMHFRHPQAISAAEKDEERDYIIANGTAPPEGVSREEHQRRIIDYCWTDVDGTEMLFPSIFPDEIPAPGALPQMNPYPVWEQALLRGKYSVVCAYVEHNGLQIRPDYLEVEKHKDAISIAAAKDLEAKYSYDVYYFKKTMKRKTGLVEESVHWSNRKFDNLIKRMNLHGVWPKFTSKGEASTDDTEAFEPMARLHPELEPLRQCRKLLLTLSKAKSCIGADCNNRFPVMPFGTVTGRNNHPASKFILGRPHCFRYFIAPREGYALVHTDIVAAEDGLAAGFSQDPRKVEIYASGKDAHLEFGKLAGLIPPDVERRNPDGTVNKEIERQRGIFKVANLAIQFGAGGVTVANNCGIPKWQGERIVADHKRVFAHYWHWADTQIKQAQKVGYIQTSLGWTMAVDESTPRNLILDFPQQAGCGEILRLATVIAVERGLGKYLSAMQHDAAYLFCPENEAEDVARELDECFAEASIVILGADNPVQLRMDTHIIRYPNSYTDDKGQELYDVIMKSLAEVKREEVTA